MAHQVINGLSFNQAIEMPDGGKIVRPDWGLQPPWSKQTALAFWNHNLFRLDRDANVIWQVTRDEGERPEWTRMREKAEAENSADPSMHSPFINLFLRLADATTNRDPLTGRGPSSAFWVEGATVICRTLDSMVYELDVGTGVAFNKTPFGIREW